MNQASNTVSSTQIPSDFSCRTKINMKRCKFTWSIENFKFCSKKFGEKLTSSNFNIENRTDLQWYIELHPNGLNKDCEGYISVFLCPTTSSTVFTKFRISILDDKNEKHYSTSYDKVFTEILGWGSRTYVKRDTLLDPKNGLLPNNTLTIICELEAAAEPSDISTVSFSKSAFQTFMPYEGLSEDLTNLYNKPKFFDVVIKADGVDFKVHKVILAARSPVFSAMFEHNMEESKTNTVEITDVDAKVMDVVLGYMYSGKFSKKEMAADILPVSDKYDLEELKGMCEEALTEQLTIENSASTLILSDTYSCTRLKDNTIHFINTHVKDVIRSNGWQEVSSRPNLALSVYMEILDRCVIMNKYN